MMIYVNGVLYNVSERLYVRELLEDLKNLGKLNVVENKCINLEHSTYLDMDKRLTDTLLEKDEIEVL